MFQRKKIYGKKINAHSPFPNDLTTAGGVFTGLDIEIFDDALIKQLSVCYGLNPRPRQMMTSNEQNAKNTSSSLVLFPEEAFFLHQFFNLQVQDLDNQPMHTELLWSSLCKLKETFVECYVSYLYLKSKNWVIKPGLKFAGDYLIYKLGPQFHHASFVVMISKDQQRKTTLSYHTNERIAETTNKGLLYLEVLFPENVSPSNYLENLKDFKVKEVMIQRQDMTKLH